MAVFNPRVTEAGLAAAFNAQSTGVELALTHIAFGTGQFEPVGNETKLVAEVKRVPIASGARITANQIRLSAIWSSETDAAAISEIGFYAGSILFAVMSRAAGGAYLFKTPGADVVFSYDWLLSVIPADSITVLVDSGQSALLALLGGHIADPEAHPQYLKKTEFDSWVGRLDSKNSVRVATTTNITLSGLQTIDTIALAAGDRVLVKNQTNAAQNGIWIVASGAWVRADDADEFGEITPGMFVPVESGAVNADTTWRLTTEGPITIGTTALTFASEFGPTGVSAGTYRSFSVDKYGRIISASNPILDIASGGTGATTAAAARTALGAQAADPTLAGLAALIVAADQLIYSTGTDTFGTSPLSAFMRTLLDDVDQSAARLTLGAAPLASPIFTGTPQAPHAPAGSSTNQIATTYFVQSAVAALVNASPATLDTLAEIATALGNDPNFATTIMTALAGKAGLSTAQAFSAAQTFGAGIYETRIAVAAANIDLSLGTVFTRTITAAVTLTVSQVPATGKVGGFILDLTNGGAAVVSWWANIKWDAGFPPVLTVSGRDILGFITHDGGATWVGLVLATDVK